MVGAQHDHVGNVELVQIGQQTANGLIEPVHLFAHFRTTGSIPVTDKVSGRETDSQKVWGRPLAQLVSADQATGGLARHFVGHGGSQNLRFDHHRIIGLAPACGRQTGLKALAIYFPVGGLGLAVGVQIGPGRTLDPNRRQFRIICCQGC